MRVGHGIEMGRYCRGLLYVADTTVCCISAISLKSVKVCCGSVTCYGVAAPDPGGRPIQCQGGGDTVFLCHQSPLSAFYDHHCVINVINMIFSIPGRHGYR